MLFVQDLNIEFDTNVILSNVSLKINSPGVYGIVGASGAGKSTLLKAIAGLINFSGDIRYGKLKILTASKQLIAGYEEIALVSQSFEEDLYFTVEENIKNNLLHLTKEDSEIFLEELIDVFELHKIRANKSLHASGGEKQRLSMACAIAKEPSVLLLDEPFVHLDVHLRSKIGSFLQKTIQDNKMIVLLVTHEGEEALSWCNKIAIIKDGNLHDFDFSEKFYKQPNSFYEGRFFGDLNSVQINGKELFFRPNQFNLNASKSNVELQLKYLKSEFRGHYIANFFITLNDEIIILYDNEEMINTKKIYVEK